MNRSRIGGHQILTLFIAVLVVSANFMQRVQAAEGDLDAGFGVGGKVVTDFFGYGDFGNNVTLQPDGKIIVPGRVVVDSSGSADFGIARYNSDGSPDFTFGVGGKVTTDFFGFNDGCLSAVVQPDGKIVAVGGGFLDGANSSNAVALARYNNDGSLDNSFGIGGKVSQDFVVGNNDQAISVVLQSDGKIIIAVGQAADTTADFRLARYNPDGSLDLTFGVAGSVATDFFGDDDNVSDIAVQSDGKIVAAGNVSIELGNNDFGLARYDVDGNLDGTFGIGGKLTTEFEGSFDGARALTLQDDGKIIAAGSAVVDFVQGFNFAVVRYNSNGTPDGTFGVGGKVTTDLIGSDSGAGVVLLCDGRIVVGGTANSSDATGSFAVVRYQSDGSLDATFGIGGKVTTDFPGGMAFGVGVGLQIDGNIVMAGYTRADGEFDSLNFALTCYDSTGCVAAPCPKQQGYWKNNPSSWPVNTLTLSGKSYSKSEMLALLNGATQGDASLILAKQLIAAKLNLENGSDPAPISSTIAHADGLLSGFAGKLPYKVKSSSVMGQAMTADAGVLENYNNALLTLGCNP